MLRYALIAMTLYGCIAEDIGYTPDDAADCCWYLPDGDSARSCFVAFIPSGACEQLTCQAAAWQTAYLDDRGQICAK